MERVVLIVLVSICACACGGGAPARTADDESGNGSVVVVPEAKADPDAKEPSVVEAPRPTRGPVTCKQDSQAADREAARKLFQLALRDFEGGDYEAAAQKFEHAYELTCTAAVLFNLATCYERLGDDDSAIATFERYLESDPAPPNAEDVQRRIDNLRRR